MFEYFWLQDHIQLKGINYRHCHCHYHYVDHSISHIVTDTAVLHYCTLTHSHTETERAVKYPVSNVCFFYFGHKSSF